ncbi:hypothetical protein Gohar_011993 [Gossypium harknessii]|uniref:Uncharacterized protein n=1 Tax=Gossypium harknessii TaxID=34285 RepID=A0A7J9GVW2_9ROSI|nr:hypothetical protein [Gossypium harknessii]
MDDASTRKCLVASLTKRPLDSKLAVAHNFVLIQDLVGRKSLQPVFMYCLDLTIAVRSMEPDLHIDDGKEEACQIYSHSSVPDLPNDLCLVECLLIISMDISLKVVPYRETVGMSIWLREEGDFRDVGPKGMDGNVMHEDGQILIADGKKRPRSYSNVSPVSFHKDSNKISGELINASQSTRSADLAKQSVQKFQHMLNKINPQVVFLIETKLDIKRMKWIQRRCGFGFGIDIDISAKGLHGELTMGWK